MDRDLYIDEQAELLSQIGNAHLFIIGIDAYENGISPLNNCVRDAEKLKKILTEKYHFLKENVKELYNENASLENIITQLDEYSAKLGEKDSLLISFSGHGFYKNEIGYLVPADATNGKVFGFLNNEQLKSYLKSCKAKHILLVVDSCYSGSFLLKDKDGNEQKSLANEVAKYKSRWVLAAGRIEKVADGEYGKHSPFATTLHTYLEKNTDKVFCISDLAQYVKNITPHNSNQFPIAGILRDANDEGGEFVFFPRNNEKEDFALCKTKADFIHFLQKYKDASPTHIAHTNAQIKAFEEQEIAEKAASQRKKAYDLYQKILSANWEEKGNLIQEYKNRFSEIKSDLYLNVLAEGKKVDDYKDWKRVNLQSENALEYFILKHNHNFFIEEAKNTLRELVEANQRRERATKFEHEKKNNLFEDNQQTKASKNHNVKEIIIEENAPFVRIKLQKENSFLRLFYYSMLGVLIIGIIVAGVFIFGIKVKGEQNEKNVRVKINPINPNIEMVLVGGGIFEMGGNQYEGEIPIHTVMLSDFYISKTEVTQKQWNAIMEPNYSKFKCEECPVENVSWLDTQLFIQKLNQITGEVYSLPSEAQWEFAARGGLETLKYNYSGSNVLGDIAWYRANSGKKTNSVGKKAPNELGIYDMTGNVWEWCQDDWHDNYENAPTNGVAWLDTVNSNPYKIIRGGSWDNSKDCSRIPYRLGYVRDTRDCYFGFRLVRKI